MARAAQMDVGDPNEQAALEQQERLERETETSDVTSEFSMVEAPSETGEKEPVEAQVEVVTDEAAQGAAAAAVTALFESLPTYGNYGGFNYSAGAVGGDPLAPDAPLPVDALDGIFRTHDVAFSRAQSDAERAAADKELEQAAKQLLGKALSGESVDLRPQGLAALPAVIAAFAIKDVASRFGLPVLAVSAAKPTGATPLGRAPVDARAALDAVVPLATPRGADIVEARYKRVPKRQFVRGVKERLLMDPRIERNPGPWKRGLTLTRRMCQECSPGRNNMTRLIAVADLGGLAFMSTMSGYAEVADGWERRRSARLSQLHCRGRPTACEACVLDRQCGQIADAARLAYALKAGEARMCLPTGAIMEVYRMVYDAAVCKKRRKVPCLACLDKVLRVIALSAVPKAPDFVVTGGELIFGDTLANVNHDNLWERRRNRATDTKPSCTWEVWCNVPDEPDCKTTQQLVLENRCSEAVFKSLAARDVFMNSGWVRDLVVDGDVESNPGPVDLKQYFKLVAEKYWRPAFHYNNFAFASMDGMLQGTIASQMYPALMAQRNTVPSAALQPSYDVVTGAPSPIYYDTTPEEVQSVADDRFSIYVVATGGEGASRILLNPAYVEMYKKTFEPSMDRNLTEQSQIQRANTIMFDGQWDTMWMSLYRSVFGVDPSSSAPHSGMLLLMKLILYAASLYGVDPEFYNVFNKNAMLPSLQEQFIPRPVVAVNGRFPNSLAYVLPAALNNLNVVVKFITFNEYTRQVSGFPSAAMYNGGLGDFRKETWGVSVAVVPWKNSWGSSQVLAYHILAHLPYPFCPIGNLNNPTTSTDANIAVSQDRGVWYARPSANQVRIPATAGMLTGVGEFNVYFGVLVVLCDAQNANPTAAAPTNYSLLGVAVPSVDPAAAPVGVADYLEAQLETVPGIVDARDSAIETAIRQVSQFYCSGKDAEDSFIAAAIAGTLCPGPTMRSEINNLRTGCRFVSDDPANLPTWPSSGWTVLSGTPVTIAPMLDELQEAVTTPAGQKPIFVTNEEIIALDHHMTVPGINHIAMTGLAMGIITYTDHDLVSADTYAARPRWYPLVLKGIGYDVARFIDAAAQQGGVGLNSFLCNSTPSYNAAMIKQLWDGALKAKGAQFRLHMVYLAQLTAYTDIAGVRYQPMCRVPRVVFDVLESATPTKFGVSLGGPARSMQITTAATGTRAVTSAYLIDCDFDVAEAKDEGQVTRQWDDSAHQMWLEYSCGSGIGRDILSPNGVLLLDELLRAQYWTWASTQPQYMNAWNVCYGEFSGATITTELDVPRYHSQPSVIYDTALGVFKGLKAIVRVNGWSIYHNREFGVNLSLQTLIVSRGTMEPRFGNGSMGLGNAGTLAALMLEGFQASSDDKGKIVKL